MIFFKPEFLLFRIKSTSIKCFNESHQYYYIDPQIDNDNNQTNIHINPNYLMKIIECFVV